MRPAPCLFASISLLAGAAFLACGHSRTEKPGAAAPPAAPAPMGPIRGKVLELLPAPPYSYIRLQAAQGEMWIAVPAAAVKPGAEVTFLPVNRMADFPSSTLNRTFDVLYMGNLDGAPPAADPGPGPEEQAALGGTEFKRLPKVSRATGADAYTIAELFARRAELRDRTVRVRGQLTKYMEGILGHTWLHVWDGSVKAELVATTDDRAKAGEVVTVKGTLRLEKEVGQGMVYHILLEDAQIQR